MLIPKNLVSPIILCASYIVPFDALRENVKFVSAPVVGLLAHILATPAVVFEGEETIKWIIASPPAIF